MAPHLARAPGRGPGVPPQLLAWLLRSAYLGFYLCPRFLLQRVRERRLVFLRKAVARAMMTCLGRRRTAGEN